MTLAWSEQFASGRLQPVSPLDLPQAITKDWAWGDASGAGVRVAIIDSGIEAGHPLIGEVQRAMAFTHDPDSPAGVAVSETQAEDVFGHGTACAGIVRHVAPGCELWSLRIFGPNLRARGRVLLEALRWALDEGADVVNMSLSTPKRDLYAEMHDLVDRAFFDRTMLVAAANNVPAPTYPAEFGGVFSVAAHPRTDPFSFDYNPAPPVELGAPGVDVDVAWMGGKTMRVSGNSFAAAHISGLIARILSRHPGLTPFQVKTILHAIADNARPRG